MMLGKNKAKFTIMRYVQIIWFLSLFLIMSCSSTPVVKDVPVEQGGVVKAGGEENKQDPFLFILGPKDEIAVNVWRNDDLKRTVQIDPSGNIQFPLVGELKASGLTIVQLREKMTVLLSKYIVDPQVDINVLNLKNLKVYVLGEVKTPGTFEWRNGMLAWEGVSQAGGFTKDANEENILLFRNENDKAVIKSINLGGLLKGEKLTQDVFLRNGDIVYVVPLFIADVERFMNRLGNIISPIISLESSIVLYPQVRDVLRGKSTTPSTIVAQ
jgi:polysaccharide export outer membrane protein